MLGLLMGLLGLGGMAADSIKTSIENEEWKQEQIKEDSKDIASGKKINEDWYTAERGQQRRISTNEKVIVVDIDMGGQASKYKDYRKGDRIMYTNNWKYIRNLSAEQRELDRKNFKESHPNVKAIPYEKKAQYFIERKRETSGFVWDMTFNIGDSYKDVRTGEIYYVRKFIFENFKEEEKEKFSYKQNGTFINPIYYMNKQGYLVGLSDDNMHHHYDLPDEPYDSCAMEKINAFMEYFNQKQKAGGWSAGCIRNKDYKLGYFKSYYLADNEKPLINIFSDLYGFPFQYEEKAYEEKHDVVSEFISLRDQM